MNVLREMEDVLGSDFEGPSADSDTRLSFNSDDGEGGSIDGCDDVSSDDKENSTSLDESTSDSDEKKY